MRAEASQVSENSVAKDVGDRQVVVSVFVGVCLWGGVSCRAFSG